MKYRKRPAIVEAIIAAPQYRNLEEITAFVGHANLCPIERRPDYVLKIRTLEGDMAVGFGDFIIKGVRGEFYPCKPDIFAETYEPICDHCEKASCQKQDCSSEHKGVCHGRFNGKCL